MSIAERNLTYPVPITVRQSMSTEKHLISPGLVNPVHKLQLLAAFQANARHAVSLLLAKTRPLMRAVAALALVSVCTSHKQFQQAGSRVGRGLPW